MQLLRKYIFLTDEKRGWIHNLIAIEYKESQQYKTNLFAGIKNLCLNNKCSEIAAHASVDDYNTNDFYLKEGGQHSALVYEWNKFYHHSVCQEKKQ